jgi:hypothetical protein
VVLVTEVAARLAGERLPDLAGSRHHRRQWVSVAAEYLGRRIGTARYRLLDGGRP